MMLRCGHQKLVNQNPDETWTPELQKKPGAPTTKNGGGAQKTG